MRETARDVPHKHPRERDQSVRDSAGIHEIAGQDEKRDGQQGKGVNPAD